MHKKIYLQGLTGLILTFKSNLNECLSNFSVCLNTFGEPFGESAPLKEEQGAQYPIGKNLKVVWSAFSTLS